MGLGLGSLNPVRIVQGKGEIGEALGPAAPVLVGLGLNALAPGVGSAVGASLGLGAAAGTGVLVGGVTALASGNLQQGLMAGLGAYGGASIGAGLTGMGESSIAAQRASMDEIAAQTGIGSGAPTTAPTVLEKMGAGLGYAAQNPAEALKTLGEGSALKGAGILGAAAAPVLAGQMVQTATPAPGQSPGLIRPYDFQRKVITPTDMVQPKYQEGQSTRERNWFEDTYTALPTYKAPGPEYKAEGGMIEDGEPVVRMAFGGMLKDAVRTVKGAIPSEQQTGPKYEGLPSYNYDPETQSFTRDYGVGPAPVKAEEGAYGSGGGFGDFFGSGLRSLINDINYGVAKHNYNQALDAAIEKDPNFIARKKMSQFAFDPQTQSFARISPEALKAAAVATTTPQVSTPVSTPMPTQMGDMDFGAGFSGGGGIPSLGGYASGGNPRLLKGPGDGMSDNIPAVIAGKQPARLADGEFVVPADVVSHLGNGSTEAGAKQLYKMMDRIRQKRTGKKRQAPEVNPMRAMPA